MKSLKKLDYSKLKSEEFAMKKYFKEYSLDDARTKFALDNRMFRSVKSDFSSDPEFTNDLWQCEAGCGRVDTISHVQVCPGYEKLRVNRNLEDSLELVHYFQDVLDLRMGLEKYK